MDSIDVVTVGAVQVGGPDQACSIGCDLCYEAIVGIVAAKDSKLTMINLVGKVAQGLVVYGLRFLAEKPY
jgi:hypothetical protein